ncbi:MAG: isopentenyl-diphosphate Delta-isomerase [Chitinophagaceae bacterium]
MEYVILVNEKDEEVGSMEKMQAHSEAKLHRAFSVFVFNSMNKLLLQRRASGKYHSPDLWTNTCCSHPRPGEKTIDAAKRRLKEEMGFETELEHAFSFIYEAELDNSLTEHEFDHVYFGLHDDMPAVNPEEVSEWKHETLEDISNDMKAHPESYTVWFKIVFERVMALRS